MSRPYRPPFPGRDNRRFDDRDWDRDRDRDRGRERRGWDRDGPRYLDQHPGLDKPLDDARPGRFSGPRGTSPTTSRRERSPPGEYRRAGNHPSSTAYDDRDRDARFPPRDGPRYDSRRDDRRFPPPSSARRDYDDDRRDGRRPEASRRDYDYDYRGYKSRSRSPPGPTRPPYLQPATATADHQPGPPLPPPLPTSDRPRTPPPPPPPGTAYADVRREEPSRRSPPPASSRRYEGYEGESSVTARHRSRSPSSSSSSRRQSARPVSPVNHLSRPSSSETDRRTAEAALEFGELPSSASDRRSSFTRTSAPTGPGPATTVSIRGTARSSVPPSQPPGAARDTADTIAGRDTHAEWEGRRLHFEAPAIPTGPRGYPAPRHTAPNANNPTFFYDSRQPQSVPPPQLSQMSLPSHATPSRHFGEQPQPGPGHRMDVDVPASASKTDDNGDDWGPAPSLPPTSAAETTKADAWGDPIPATPSSPAARDAEAWGSRAFEGPDGSSSYPHHMNTSRPPSSHAVSNNNSDSGWGNRSSPAGTPLSGKSGFAGNNASFRGGGSTPTQTTTTTSTATTSTLAPSSAGTVYASKWNTATNNAAPAYGGAPPPPASSSSPAFSGRGRGGVYSTGATATAAGWGSTQSPAYNRGPPAGRQDAWESGNRRVNPLTIPPQHHRHHHQQQQQGANLASSVEASPMPKREKTIVSLTPEMDANLAQLKKKRIGVLAQTYLAAASASRRAGRALKQAEDDFQLVKIQCECRADFGTLVKEDDDLIAQDTLPDMDGSLSSSLPLDLTPVAYLYHYGY